MMLLAPVVAPEAGYAKPGAGRYRPSWFDRLKVRVEQLPGAVWMFYLGGALVLYGLRTVLQWIDGAIPAGAVGTALIVSSAWPWYGLAAMHYLDRAAGRALDELQPILSGTPETQRELRYQLTTMPARPALIASLGVLLSGALVFLVTSLDTVQGEHIDQHIAKTFGLGTSPVVLGVTLVVVWIVGGLFFYHTTRQMLLIRAITTHHINVTVFHLAPLHRLSNVTAATAAACSGGVAVGMLTFTVPQAVSDPVALSLALCFMFLAFVTFIWPLLGIHDVIATEKARLHVDAQERMRQALVELQRRQDNADYDGVGTMNNALAALLQQQAVVDKISVWPWRTETIGAVSTAIFLPLVIWLITRALGQVIP